MDGEKCGYIDGERGVPTKMEKGEVPEMDGEKCGYIDGERGVPTKMAKGEVPEMDGEKVPGQKEKCPNKRKSA